MQEIPKPAESEWARRTLATNRERLQQEQLKPKYVVGAIPNDDNFTKDESGKLTAIAGVPVDQVAQKLHFAQYAEKQMAIIARQNEQLARELNRVHAQLPVNPDLIPPNAADVKPDPVTINGVFTDPPIQLLLQEYQASAQIVNQAQKARQKIQPLTAEVKGKTPVFGLLGDAAARVSPEGIHVYTRDPKRDKANPNQADKIIPFSAIQSGQYTLHVEPRPFGLTSVTRALNRIFGKKVDPPGNVTLKEVYSGQTWTLMQAGQPDTWVRTIQESAIPLAQESDARRTLITLHQQFPELFGQLVLGLSASNESGNQ